MMLMILTSDILILRSCFRTAYHPPRWLVACTPAVHPSAPLLLLPALSSDACSWKRKEQNKKKKKENEGGLTS